MSLIYKGQNLYVDNTSINKYSINLNIIPYIISITSNKTTLRINDNSNENNETEEINKEQ